MSDETPKELQKLMALMDAIHTVRMSIKTHLQNKIREYNYNITFEMFQVLAVLWRQNNINQQEIADRVQKNKASLTPLIDNLSKRNLVVRNEDPVDRRNKIISLTKEGFEYRERLQPMIHEIYESFKIDISITELETVTEMLRKLNQNITSI
jgi:DNA-binding MarR family transcriptional regulator